MSGFRIVGSGYAKAEHKISNDDFKKVIDTSDEWIRSRTGIETRYFSSKENTSDLAYRAAAHAIENSGYDAQRIKYIIVATITPDSFTPATACIIQDKLGLSHTQLIAFDINAACSGFVYALQVTHSLLQQDELALVIGSETLSKIIDFTDRNTCILFGDGAGAMLIEKDESKEVSFYTRSIGDINHNLYASGISLNAPLSNQTKDYSYLTMDGKEVFRFAVRVIPEAIEQLCFENNIDIHDIDLIIPHQANLRIIDYVARKMNIPLEKFYTNLQEFGNTSAASIAIAFAQASEQGVIKKGMKIILVGFGGGLTYGASYIEC